MEVKERIIYTDRIEQLKLTGAEVVFSANGIRPETAKTVIVISAGGLKANYDFDVMSNLKCPIHSTNMIKSDYLTSYKYDVRDYRNVQHSSYAHSTITPSTIKNILTVKEEIIW